MEKWANMQMETLRQSSILFLPLIRPMIPYLYAVSDSQSALRSSMLGSVCVCKIMMLTGTSEEPLTWFHLWTSVHRDGVWVGYTWLGATELLTLQAAVEMRYTLPNSLMNCIPSSSPSTKHLLFPDFQEQGLVVSNSSLEPRPCGKPMDPLILSSN